MCVWYIASAYDMLSISAVTWSTWQCIVSVFVCHKGAQNIIIHGILVLDLEKEVNIPWCWMLWAGLLCFVIVICVGKYLITNTLMMSKSELFFLEVFFLIPCFHDKCLKFMRSLFRILYWLFWSFCKVFDGLYFFVYLCKVFCVAIISLWQLSVICHDSKHFSIVIRL